MGDVDATAHRVEVDIEDTLSSEQALLLVSGVKKKKQQ